MRSQSDLGNNSPRPSKLVVLLIVAVLSVPFYSVLADENVPDNAIRFSFEKVENLSLGSSQARAEQLFGIPEKAFRQTSTAEITWVYIERDHSSRLSQRLTLTFSGPNLILSNIVYKPLPPDAVSILSGLTKHFSRSHFKTVEPSSCGEHYTFNEGFDYDLAAGLSYQHDQAGRVTSISIQEPKTLRRGSASELTGCEHHGHSKDEALEEITPALK